MSATNSSIAARAAGGPALGARGLWLPALVPNAALTGPRPRVLERVALGYELAGAHRDPLARSAIKCRLSFGLSLLVIHGLDELRILHAPESVQTRR